MNWLEAVIVEAKESGWCTSPFCTTCGALEFRRAIWSGAALEVGLHLDLSRRMPNAFLARVAPSDRELLVRTVIAGLHGVSPNSSHSEAIRTVIMDLDPPLLRHGVMVVLDDELADTPVGVELARMRVHAERVRARRQETADYESPATVEARRQRKRAEKAEAHEQRLQMKAQRDLRRSIMIDALTAMTPRARLLLFATDDGLELGSVPAELIPVKEAADIEVEKDLLVKLIARIDRRRGAWGKLRRVLEGSAK